MLPFETFISRRYLRIRHQGRLVPLITVLATVGVALGVMVLMVVIAVMTGFQSELKRRILGIEYHAMVMRYNQWIPDDPFLVDQVGQIPGVVNAAPIVYAQGMVRSPGGVAGIVLRGVDPQRSGLQVGTFTSAQLLQLLEGGNSSEGPNKVILGAVLADKLHVQIGDNVLVMVAGTRSASGQQLPKMHRLEVSGLFDTGMHQYDGTMGFMGVDQLQAILGLPTLVTGIEVRVVDVDRVAAIGRAIGEALGDAYWVSDWQQMHRNLFAMLLLQKVVMYIILTLIILVAAFNIASALIMMVKEKTKDIAILKTMGATRSSLQRIFLCKGMIIGLVGVCIGVISGSVICWIMSRYQFINLPGDIYFLTTLPVKVEAADIAIIILGTLAICFCASLYPARQASKMKPVEGIRYG